MNTNTTNTTNTNEMKKAEITFDAESVKILSDVDPIYREAVVNLGVKLAGETEIYRQYFRKASVKMEEVTNVGIISNSANINLLGNTSNTQLAASTLNAPTPTPAPAPAPAQASSWDDF